MKNKYRIISAMSVIVLFIVSGALGSYITDLTNLTHTNENMEEDTPKERAIENGELFPSNPELISPPYGIEIKTLTPDYKWLVKSDMFGVKLIEFQIKVLEDSGLHTQGTKVVLEKTYPISAVQKLNDAFNITPPIIDYVNGGLADGKNYHWHIRAFNGYFWSEWANDSIDNSDHMDFSVSIPNSQGISVESATGKSDVYLDTSSGSVQNLISVDPVSIAESPPPEANLYYGLLRFEITGVTPGGRATLTLTFPNDLPPGTKYWKYGANHNPHWYTIPATIKGNKLTIMLVDGGDGDDDSAVNGIIKDDGGPSLPHTPEQIPEFLKLAIPIFAAIGLLFMIRRTK